MKTNSKNPKYVFQENPLTSFNVYINNHFDVSIFTNKHFHKLKEEKRKNGCLKKRNKIKKNDENFYKEKENRKHAI
jgi:hypothetical protein